MAKMRVNHDVQSLLQSSNRINFFNLADKKLDMHKSMLVKMIGEAHANNKPAGIPTNMHLNQFLGEWLKEKLGARTGGDVGAEDIGMKGSTSHGWDDSHLEDSEIEDHAWDGGVRRAGEEYSSEEAYEDEWGSDDDDDHGGHMMPIPGL